MTGRHDGRGGRIRPLVGSALSVAAITGFARLNGGVREVLVAREFGTSRALEAFLVGFGLISLLTVAVAGAMPGALVPTYFRHDGRDHEGRARQLVQTVLPRLVGSLVVAAALIAAAAPLLAPVIGGGFPPATRRELVRVIGLLAPVLVAMGVAAFMSSLLTARKRFSTGALPQVANPVTTIVVLLLSERATATGLALAFLLGALAEATVATGLVAATGTLRRAAVRGPATPHAAPGGSSDWRLFGPMFGTLAVGLAVQASNTVIDQAVASHLEAGSVAVLAFGSRIPGFLSAVGITAVGTVVLPRFAELAAQSRSGDLRRAIRAAVLPVGLVASLGALLLSVGAEAIIGGVFGRGRFSSADVAAAASVQAIAAWQVPANLVGTIYLRVLNARRRQRAVLGIAAVAAVANLVVDIVLAAWLGVPGLALSTVLIITGSTLAFRAVAVRDLRRSPSQEPVA